MPCHDEGRTVGEVVRLFRAALPDAEVVVYDNNSCDGTASLAAAAGARVRPAALQGKGNVVARMFADEDADVYLLVDGDGTYDPSLAPQLVRMVLEDGLDMVCGKRAPAGAAAYRPGHRSGNRLLTGLVRLIFGRRFDDMLTGYRAMSRRFVKSFGAHSCGFEIETELTVHALQLRCPTAEVATLYLARPEGSTSKLNTIRDGVRILRLIGLLAREERPLQFFSLVAAMSLVLAGALFAPILIRFLDEGVVVQIPTLIGVVGLSVAGLLSFACGVVLDSVARGRLEQRRLAYLAIPGPGSRAVR